MIDPKDINVLIACEESQAECIAFRERGFNAFSCDLQHARYYPDMHIQGDVTLLLQGKTRFTTESGVEHEVAEWHIIIAHPPCTYLCKVGSPHLYKDADYNMRIQGEWRQVNKDRYDALRDARRFFYLCLAAKTRFLAVENPLPMALAGLPKPSCFVHPSWYGVKYTKKTLYWLRNLPPLMPEIEYPNPKSFVRSSRGKYRSRTFPQVAAAIAKQWGDYVLDELNQ